MIHMLFKPTTLAEAMNDVLSNNSVLALLRLPILNSALQRVFYRPAAALATLYLYAVNPYAVFQIIIYKATPFAIEVTHLVSLLPRPKDGLLDWATFGFIAVTAAVISVTPLMLPQIMIAPTYAWLG
jgi:hypothetical protein